MKRLHPLMVQWALENPILRAGVEVLRGTDEFPGNKVPKEEVQPWITMASIFTSAIHL